MMHKKYIITIHILFFSFLMNAQVGVNTANPQGILHIDGAKDNPVTGSPAVANQENDFVVDNTGKIGIGTNTPSVKLDVRSSVSGSNNTVGIGNTTLTAGNADGGAVRYNSGKIEYSNGNQWVVLGVPKPPRAVVVASKTTNNFQCTLTVPQARNTIPNRSPCYLTDWSDFDPSNTFAQATGIFTAPRDGVYIATFTFAIPVNTVSSNPVDSNQIEAIWEMYNSSNVLVNTVKCANNFPANGNVIVGSNCLASFYMTAGQSIRPQVWLDLQPAGTRQIITTGGYNNLTIAEQ